MAGKTPPKGLQVAGKRLWRSIADDYELDVHEEALLLQAGRTVDRLDDIAAALESESLTVTNFKGDPVAHPLLVEQRLQSITLSRLLASLRLPSGEQDDGALKRPQRRGAARGSYGIRGPSDASPPAWQPRAGLRPAAASPRAPTAPT